MGEGEWEEMREVKAEGGGMTVVMLKECYSPIDFVEKNALSELAAKFVETD